MLENFPLIARSPDTQLQRRVLAMAAALEIAKASAGAASSKTHSDKVADDLNYATKNIEALADKILSYITS